MKYALAAVAILIASQAAYAGGNPFVAGFAQGFMQTQQPPPYQPYYYSPPPAFIPQTQSQTYTFPNGRTMTCMTTGGITNCF